MSLIWLKILKFKFLGWGQVSGWYKPLILPLGNQRQVIAICGFQGQLGLRISYRIARLQQPCLKKRNKYSRCGGNVALW